MPVAGQKLTSQLARAQRVITNRPRLEASLLIGSARYLARRLQIILLARIYGYAVHIVETYVLLLTLNGKRLTHSFLASASGAILIGVAWFVLEVLRADLRDSTAAQFDRIASRWWSASVLIAGVILVGSAGVLALSDWRGHLAFPELVYVEIVAVRTALDVMARAYYAIAYAHGRIQRPLWSIWVSPTISIGLMALGAARFGVWGALAGMAVAVPLPRAMMMYFSARTLREQGRNRPRWRPRLVFAAHWPWRRIGFAALAGFLSQAGNVLMFSAVLTTDDPRALVLAQLIRPALVGASTFGQAFYPDFVKLLTVEALHLRERFIRWLIVVALAIASMWYGMVWGTGMLVLPHITSYGFNPAWLLLALLALLAVSSIAQSALLAASHFRALSISGLGFGAIILWQTDPLLAFATASVAAIGAFVQLYYDRRPRRHLTVDDRRRVRWCVADVRGLTVPQREQLAVRVGKLVAPNSAWLDRSTLHWLETRRAIDPATWIGMTSGQVPLPQRDVVGSLALIRRQLHAPVERRDRSLTRIVDELRVRIPSALIVAVGHSRIRALDMIDAQLLWTDALRWRDGVGRAELRAYDVTAWPMTGPIEMIAAIPRSVPLEQRTAWRAYLRERERATPPSS